MRERNVVEVDSSLHWSDRAEEKFNEKKKKRDFSSRRIKIIRKFLYKYLSFGKHGMHELYVRKTNKFLKISEKAEVQLKKKSCSDIFMYIVFSLV